MQIKLEPFHWKTTDPHTTNTENFTKVWESRQHIHDVKLQMIGLKSLTLDRTSPPSEARNQQVTRSSKSPSKNKQMKLREQWHTHWWYWHTLSHIHVSLKYQVTGFVVLLQMFVHTFAEKRDLEVNLPSSNVQFP